MSFTFWFRNSRHSRRQHSSWLRSLMAPVAGSLTARKQRRSRRRRLLLEALEDRVMLSGTWLQLPTPLGDLGTMLLLPNGSVMAQNGDSATWFRFTPDPSTGKYDNGTWSTALTSIMSTPRRAYGSAVLPNGNVMVFGGEYTTDEQNPIDVNSGDMYNPATNQWTPIKSIPTNLDPPNIFGDGTLELLPNGQVFAAPTIDDSSGLPKTPFLYDPTTQTWSAAATKLDGYGFAEETLVKLPGTTGDILNYDQIASQARFGQLGQAEYYDPSKNQWFATGSVPVQLGNEQNIEIGPGLLLPNGKVFYVGANGNVANGTVAVALSNTALYDPTTNTWSAGPTIPGGLTADDAPGAVLPDGNVIFVADSSTLTSMGGRGYIGPSEIFEFNPIANTITPLTNLPYALSTALLTDNGESAMMLVLPTGEVAFTDGGQDLWTYSETTPIDPSWAPTISSVVNDSGSTYTLSGTQLNGLDEGASFGDDAQMAENYPIVKITDSTGKVSYAATFNWSDPGTVATGSTPETTQFTMPSGVAPGNFTVNVIADGIPSAGHFITIGGKAPLTYNADNGGVAQTLASWRMAPTSTCSTTISSSSHSPSRQRPISILAQTRVAWIAPSPSTSAAGDSSTT